MYASFNSVLQSQSAVIATGNSNTSWCSVCVCCTQLQIVIKLRASNFVVIKFIGVYSLVIAAINNVLAIGLEDISSNNIAASCWNKTFSYHQRRLGWGIGACEARGVTAK